METDRTSPPARSALLRRRGPASASRRVVPAKRYVRQHIPGRGRLRPPRRLYDPDERFDIRSFLRKPHFTYEYKDISELLVEMRESTFNIAIVLDEYGEMTGLITLEDILEEIVGEIHDEYDENENELIKKLSDHEYVIEGSMSLDDVNDHLGTHLESEDYDSLGGLVIEHLDRLPIAGDQVITSDGIRLVVDKLDKNRIENVRVFLPEKEPDEPQVNDSDVSAES